MDELSLLDNYITISSPIKYLQKHKNIKKLSLDRLDLTDYSFINKFPNLIELSLSNKNEVLININFSYQNNLKNLK